MLQTIQNLETPFKLEISFHKYLEFLENIRDNDEIDFRVSYAKSLLENAAHLKALRDGTNDIDFIYENEGILRTLLSDLFPTALTHNEIKAVTVPFSNFSFNFTARFRKILDDAGQDFQLDLRDISNDEYYIFNCCTILQSYFNKNVRISFPFYYDIPDKNGILKHYRITINVDFTDILPTENSLILTDDEIAELMNNFDNIQLWKRKFPPQSWISRGFSITTLTDATAEVALSDIKSTLLRLNPENVEADENLIDFFKSYFDISDLRFGIKLFNEKDLSLQPIALFQDLFSNEILNFWEEFFTEREQRQTFLNDISQNPEAIVIPDIAYVDDEVRKHPTYNNLVDHNIKSCMIIPVVWNNNLLAMMELASSQPNALNGLKLKKMEVLFPFISNAFLRFRNDKQNQISAIIQREYTTLHPSVAWKFEEQAEKFFNASFMGETYALKEISFKNLIPLFGQTDIKSSSEKRTLCLKEDLSEQISAIETIIDQQNIAEKDKYFFALGEFRAEILDHLKADTENRFQRFIIMEINPLLETLGGDENITNYFQKLNPKNQLFYKNQGKLDDAISLVNRHIANFLDEKQKKAQQIFPHYFDRFKSDGVEHDLFIGQSITPNLELSDEIISKLRYWQLKTIAKIERKYQTLKPTLPYELDVTSLIMVYNERLDIRYRMDEKRFDVDGAYNSRYEITKKRIEKAMIKGTSERLTVPHKITIVYFSEEDKLQYLEFINRLQEKNILGDSVEEVELQDMPGTTGLRALRVSV